jgi:hypothetical protein
MQILYHINIRTKKIKESTAALYVIYTTFLSINNKGRKILSQLDATYSIDATDYGTDYQYLRSLTQ